MTYEISMTVVIDTPTFQGARLEGNVTVPTTWLEAFVGDPDEIVVRIANTMKENTHVNDSKIAEDMLLLAATVALTSDIGPSIKSMPVSPVDVTFVLRPVSPTRCDWTIVTQDYASYVASQKDIGDDQIH
jgi:hypothetical protein